MGGWESDPNYSRSQSLNTVTHSFLLPYFSLIAFTSSTSYIANASEGRGTLGSFSM